MLCLYTQVMHISVFVLTLCTVHFLLRLGSWEETHPVSREGNRRDWSAAVSGKTHIDFHMPGFNLKSNHSGHDIEGLSSNETIKGSSKAQSQEQK